MSCTYNHHHRRGRFRPAIGVSAIALACALGAPAMAQVGLNVYGNGDPATPITQYKFLLQEDLTYRDRKSTDSLNTLSLNFHTSYMPVLFEGDQSNVGFALDPVNGIIKGNRTRYFITVMPTGGQPYTIGGAAFEGRDSSVDVAVEETPVPAAQFSIYAFVDNNPVNSQADEEAPLAGVTFAIKDAAGKYGIAGGQVFTDVFGNPLGTTYDASGAVLELGDGVIMTDETGYAIVKNVAPGKYGIVPTAPQGDPGGPWIQTTTIEGSKTIDVWVQKNESELRNEVGPAGPHASFGFVQEFTDPSLSGGQTITGTIVNLHLDHPPGSQAFDGGAFESSQCYVALNRFGATSEAVHVSACDNEGEFTIPDVPPGSYQLGFWDKDLLNIFASRTLTVEAGGCNGGGADSCALGRIPVNHWFYHIDNYVFLDVNENGFPDIGEPAFNNPNHAFNVRWRDGTIHLASSPDAVGFAPFPEGFPFFAWQVLESAPTVKPTGVSFVVDAGGEVRDGLNPPKDPDTYPGLGFMDPDDPTFGILNPAEHDVAFVDADGNEFAINPNTENNLVKTIQGPVLTQATQAFLGQSLVAFWGVKPYSPFDVPDIAGSVTYGVTRAENDPANATIEEWEPGVPRVQVALYPTEDNSGAVSEEYAAGLDLADVDNYPFRWSITGRPNHKGPEDIKRAVGTSNCVGAGDFCLGDAIAITHTDSWDDAKPTGCAGEDFVLFDEDGNEVGTADCFEGLRTFNQMTDGVFDGGFAFTEEDGVETGEYYIVEAIPPRFVDLDDQVSPYRVIDSADKNVDFGEEYVPTTLALAAPCVGPNVDVPTTLRLSELLGDPIETAPAFSGEQRSCAMKLIQHLPTRLSLLDFSLATDVPIAAQGYGMVLDDFATEFDLNSPNFGEKYAPPFMPVRLRDWQGKVLGETFTDQNGKFDLLVPSTITANAPTPSGMSPQMASVCVNDPGPVGELRNGLPRLDPNYNTRYTTVCFTLQFMPGSTTYLDTPINPGAAFPGPNQDNLVCELPESTPVIDWTRGRDVKARGAGSNINGPVLDSNGDRLLIRGAGFGAAIGRVGVVPEGGTPLDIVYLDIDNANRWRDDRIIASVPPGTPSGQLVVETDDGRSPLNTVKVTIVEPGTDVIEVGSGGFDTIQSAIDGAAPGEMIVIPRGTYQENLVMHKPVRLQGSGAGDTTVFGFVLPSARLEAYRATLAATLTASTASSSAIRRPT
jgi:hypothetical protein